MGNEVDGIARTPAGRGVAVTNGADASGFALPPDTSRCRPLDLRDPLVVLVSVAASIAAKSPPRAPSPTTGRARGGSAAVARVVDGEGGG